MKEYLPFVFVVCLLAAAGTGCVRDRQGPMERLGENVDDAAENLGDAMDDLYR